MAAGASHARVAGMSLYDDLEPENDAERELIEKTAKGEWYFGPGAGKKQAAARLTPRIGPPSCLPR